MNDIMDKYKKERLQGLSNIEAVGVLYEEAINALRNAKDKFAKDDPAFKDDLLFCQKIVKGLTIILDFKQGADIARNLLALYSYMDRRLLIAREGIKATPRYCDEAIEIFMKLREGWQAVIDQEKTVRSKKDASAKPSSGGLEISI